jgi:hypothetical protein
MNYERGNLLDLNDFYCASNLPRLYRLRARPGDSQRADEAAIVTVQACRRALALGLENEWTKSTLLGMAFYRGDVVEAEHLREAVLEEGPKAWQLSSTLNDLRVDIRHQSDPQVRHALGAVLDDLERLLAES